jgi:hypothetical protein
VSVEQAFHVRVRNAACESIGSEGIYRRAVISRFDTDQRLLSCHDVVPQSKRLAGAPLGWIPDRDRQLPTHPRPWREGWALRVRFHDDPKADRVFAGREWRQQRRRKHQGGKHVGESTRRRYFRALTVLALKGLRLKSSRSVHCTHRAAEKAIKRRVALLAKATMESSLL